MLQLPVILLSVLGLVVVTAFTVMAIRFRSRHDANVATNEAAERAEASLSKTAWR